MKSINIIFDLLTEDEQDELIKQGLGCCGGYSEESGCCPFGEKKIGNNENNA